MPADKKSKGKGKGAKGNGKGPKSHEEASLPQEETPAKKESVWQSSPDKQVLEKKAVVSSKKDSFDVIETVTSAALEVAGKSDAKDDEPLPEKVREQMAAVAEAPPAPEEPQPPQQQLDNDEKEAKQSESSKGQVTKDAMLDEKSDNTDGFADAVSEQVPSVAPGEKNGVPESYFDGKSLVFIADLLCAAVVLFLLAQPVSSACGDWSATCRQTSRGMTMIYLGIIAYVGSKYSKLAGNPEAGKVISQRMRRNLMICVGGVQTTGSAVGRTGRQLSRKATGALSDLSKGREPAYHTKPDLPKERPIVTPRKAAPSGKRDNESCLMCCTGR